jgi:hypothetical protein
VREEHVGQLWEVPAEYAHPNRPWSMYPFHSAQVRAAADDVCYSSPRNDSVRVEGGLKPEGAAVVEQTRICPRCVREGVERDLGDGNGGVEDGVRG